MCIRDRSRQIVDRYRVPTISTGDLLRDNVALGTELGIAAKTIMARGELVPDELMYGIVATRLRETDCKMCIRDRAGARCATGFGVDRAAAGKACRLPAGDAQVGGFGAALRLQRD